MNRRNFIKNTLITAAGAVVVGSALANTKIFGDKKMKILVITGSPHKKGTSALLADEFIKGAEEKGHNVFRFDSAFEELHPCVACESCKTGDKKCIYKDGMEKLNPKLFEADMVVFVTPLYYFGFSSQIKMVIDRFHANNYKIINTNKKAMLLATSAAANDWTMEGLVTNYKNIIRFLGWENSGMLLATGCPVREVIEKTDFPQKAYELGKNL